MRVSMMLIGLAASMIMARAGIACPTPVHARNGNVTGTLNDKPAAILTFLDGVSLRRPTAEHCTFAGRALAELHEIFLGQAGGALELVAG